MSRTTINDFQPALESIDKLLAKYDEKKESAWLKQSPFEHLQHVLGHLDSLMQSLRAVPTTPYNFEDFQSLACRALMALTLQLELESSKKAEKMPSAE